MTMSMELTQTLLFLSGSFVLGVALGWAIWKFKSPKQAAEERTENDFWQDRLKKARAERDLSQGRITDLEKEISALRAKIASAT